MNIPTDPPKDKEAKLRELTEYACCDPHRDANGVRWTPCGTCVVCGNIRRAYSAGMEAAIFLFAEESKKVPPRIQTAFEAGRVLEREAVLAYLRCEDLSSDPRDLKVCRWAAEDIEKGIHMEYRDK